MNDYDFQLMEAMGLFDSRLHFNEELYNKAVNGMENADGTKGPHWTIDEVEEIVGKEMKKEGNKYSLGSNNIFDISYTMQMLRSDYFDLIKDTDEEWFKFAMMFLDDVDGPEGKALRYYKAMKL